MLSGSSNHSLRARLQNRWHSLEALCVRTHTCLCVHCELIVCTCMYVCAVYALCVCMCAFVCSLSIVCAVFDLYECRCVCMCEHTCVCVHVWTVCAWGHLCTSGTTQVLKGSQVAGTTPCMEWFGDTVQSPRAPDKLSQQTQRRRMWGNDEDSGPEVPRGATSTGLTQSHTASLYGPLFAWTHWMFGVSGGVDGGKF